MDCKSIVEALTADGTSRLPCYGAILDLKAALAIFPEYRVSFAPRKCNRLAHELATETRQNGDQLIIANVPDRLRNLVYSDCNPA